jgi:hypothetical protein
MDQQCQIVVLFQRSLTWDRKNELRTGISKLLRQTTIHHLFYNTSHSQNYSIELTTVRDDLMLVCTELIEFDQHVEDVV